MKISVVSGCLGLVVALAGTAHADAGAPAWCGDGKNMKQAMAGDLRKPDLEMRDRIIDVASLKCHPSWMHGDDAKVVDAAYGTVNKELGMTDADWSDVLDYARSDAGAIANADVAVKNDKAAWSTRDPIEQFATFGHNNVGDVFYLADAFGDKLSQAGRVGLARECLKSQAPVTWAMCQGDLDAIDGAKLAAEIHADKAHPGFARIAVRLAAHDVQLGAKARADEIAKLVAKDKAYKQLFDLAAAERKAWDARYKDRADLVALASAMDDGLVTNSRSATSGCKDKTWDQLAAAVKRLPAKAFITHRKPDQEEVLYDDDAIETIQSSLLADPDGYLAANAFTLCRVLEDANNTKEILAIRLQPRLTRWEGFRGPRSSTYTRILLADPKFDDRDAKLEYPRFDRTWFSPNQVGGATSGTVASVKANGDKATVTFNDKATKATVDIGCTQGRMHGIRGDGSVEYELNCKGSKTINVNVPIDPQTVLARYATNLKPGMTAIVSGDMIWIAWPKAGATTPGLILGQPVK